MSKLTKKEERNRKIEEFNKRRIIRSRNTLIFTFGFVTSGFLIVPVLIWIMKNVSIAAIVSLLICVLIAKLVFRNRENKKKYKIYMFGFLMSPTSLILGVWDENSSLFLSLIWVILCLYIVKKIYDKL